MIKKILLGLLFVGGLFFSFSNAYEIGVNSFTGYDSNFQITALKGGAFLTNYLGVSKSLFAPRMYQLFWWDKDTGLPYYFYQYNGTTLQGFITNFGLCNMNGSTPSTSCSYTYNIQDSLDSFKNYLSSVSAGDGFFYGADGSSYNLRLCWKSSDYANALCIKATNTLMTGSLNYSGLTFSNISTSLLGYAPGQGQYGGDGSNVSGALNNGGIELSSDYSALNYYEKHYGRDKSICYVGVDNVTSLYGQNGVSFQEGKGLSIFDTYDLLYGSGDLEHYYVWLNTWLLNYEQWFNRDGNPLYLANYNTGLNQVDLYYDNLTFPFSNNPVAFYFMADNIVNKSPESTMGSSVVSYCNIKINSGTFADIIDQADKNNITDYSEQYNTTHGLNADGSSKEYGAFLGSGVDIAFSGNVTVKNTLKNFFEEFEKVVNVGTGSSETTISNTAILPKWLIVAFLFVVLFKFLRKR